MRTLTKFQCIVKIKKKHRSIKEKTNEGKCHISQRWTQGANKKDEDERIESYEIVSICQKIDEQQNCRREWCHSSNNKAKLKQIKLKEMV